MWIMLYQVGIFLNILVKNFLCNTLEILQIYMKTVLLSCLSLIKEEKEVGEGTWIYPCGISCFYYLCAQRRV